MLYMDTHDSLKATCYNTDLMRGDIEFTVKSIKKILTYYIKLIDMQYSYSYTNMIKWQLYSPMSRIRNWSC